MRKNKYRAYQKNAKWTLPVLSINWGADGEIKSITVDNTNNNTRNVSPRSQTFYKNDPIYSLDVLILMEFTGLTDKNGKEIYEGDILEDRFVACDIQDTGLIDGEYCSGHYVETKRFVANMNLDYENNLISVGSFDGGCDKLLEEDELYNYPSGIYLIGNIHDNPELLT